MTGFNTFPRQNLGAAKEISTQQSWWLDLPCPSPSLSKIWTMVQREKHGLWPSSLRLEKPFSLGWLLFSTNLMATELLEQAITKMVYLVMVGLRWKMINMGMQGKIKPDNQIWALCIYMDELNVNMAKSLLIVLYLSKPAEGHQFPLGVRMCLVPEIDLVLNEKGCIWSNSEHARIHVIQLNWLALKPGRWTTWFGKWVPPVDAETGYDDT